MRAGSATAAAVLAVKAYSLFLTDQTAVPEALVARVVDLAREFDAGGQPRVL